ncbi:hypothetical protein A0J61_08116 [Choanephora cucurbitarum]|uniref:Serine/threonine-protein kinase HT1 n=1 Tax=Choanephora cucurbitarum TaxID=101091 RepID=A0A1C7N3Y7_9FUNG|nr:hypothetical protein A0J61_08116 [Choanephora cucurbitarum]
MLFHTVEKHIDDLLESIAYDQLEAMSLAEIIDLCKERGLPTDGNKSQLMSDLLFWPLPAPSAPQLYSSSLDSQRFFKLFLDDTASYVKYNISLNELIYGNKIGELRLTDVSEFDIAEIKHEIHVLKQLRHENVIRFIGVCTHPNHLSIVTEICTQGDLFDVIRNCPKPSFAQQIMYMYDIALGVSYLHTRSNRPSIIHRDLKSMNILISDENKAKINDFGLARIRPKANILMHTQCGTPNCYSFTYIFHRQAPEFWSTNPSYTEKVDVYACGLIFWEILTWGFYGYPYQNLSEHALYTAVKQHDVRPPMTKLTSLYPRNLLVLIMEMWETDPTLRPSMTHVVERLSTYLT